MAAKTNAITLKQIDEQIATFTTNRKALAALGHNIGMMILRHAAPAEVNDDCQGSGDCTRALKLVKAMPKSWAAGMELWFKTYSPIRVVGKNDKCEFDPKYKKLSKEEKLTWWKLAEAAETTFLEMEPEVATTKVLTVEALLKLLEQQASRITKNVEEGKVAEADAPAALLMASDLVALSKKKYRSAAKSKKNNKLAANDPAVDMANAANG